MERKLEGLLPCCGTRHLYSRHVRHLLFYRYFLGMLRLSLCVWWRDLLLIEIFKLTCGGVSVFCSFHLQFTIPGGRHAIHHASLMQNAGAARVLRAAAAAATAPLEAKIFARIVLRNLEHHHIESSLWRLIKPAARCSCTQINDQLSNSIMDGLLHSGIERDKNTVYVRASALWNLQVL